ncbi:MAG: rRNA maturation RNase YbeY [Pseudomonadota bacterium]
MTGTIDASDGIFIQIAIEASGWPYEETLLAFCGKTIAAAQAYLVEHAGQRFRRGGSELSVVFADDAVMRTLNSRWRARDQSTNVLSFPARALHPGQEPGPLLGDIVLARETIAREAAELSIDFDNHLIHLLVHGFLHLLGYDHVVDADAGVMENHETRILAILDLSDPYENSISV